DRALSWVEACEPPAERAAASGGGCTRDHPCPRIGRDPQQWDRAAAATPLRRDHAIHGRDGLAFHAAPPFEVSAPAEIGADAQTAPASGASRCVLPQAVCGPSVRS